MKKLVLGLSLLIDNYIAFAQNNNNVTFGAAIDFATKYSLETHLGFVAYEPSVYVRVEGKEQNSLGFTGRFGLLFDPLRSNYGSGHRFSIVQHNVTFSGLINFPTKSEYWKVLAGIGLEFCAEPSISYGTHQGSNQGTNSQTSLTIDLDSAYTKVQTYRRRILPSVSAGVSYQPPFLIKNIHFNLVLKHNLLQLFTEDIEIPYEINGNYNSATINYKPSYLKLGINYDFW